jgi:hypothetical protein
VPIVNKVTGTANKIAIEKIEIKIKIPKFPVCCIISCNNLKLL